MARVRAVLRCARVRDLRAAAHDYLAFWQLAGSWSDVFRFNAIGAAIAYAVYLAGTLFVLITLYRALRPVEAIGLIVLPLFFSLLLTIGADWHMAEIASWVLPGTALSFPSKVFIGRTLMLFAVSEMRRGFLSRIGVNRLPRSAKLHGLMLAGAALGAATPLIANFAQIPLPTIVVGVAMAALAQAGLW